MFLNIWSLKINSILRETFMCVSFSGTQTYNLLIVNKFQYLLLHTKYSEERLITEKVQVNVYILISRKEIYRF